MVIDRRVAGMLREVQFSIPRGFIVSQWLPAPPRLLCSGGKAQLPQLCPRGDRARLMQLWELAEPLSKSSAALELISAVP